jgi:hypothetical protein
MRDPAPHHEGMWRSRCHAADRLGLEDRLLTGLHLPDGWVGGYTSLQTSCGACGQACPLNSMCSGGNCICEPDFGDCDQDMATGCETPLLTTNVGDAPAAINRAGWVQNHECLLTR